MKLIRSYILAGLVVWLPILLSIFVVQFIIRLFDSSIMFLTKDYQLNIPGIGILFSLLILITTGFIATNVLGQYIVKCSDLIFEKIPFIRVIYKTSKQLIHQVFSDSSQAFRKVILVEYPKAGVWTIGFQTGAVLPQIQSHLGKDMVSIFIPTTPNPTGGHLIMVDKKDLIELDIPLETAFKLIISLGVMHPTTVHARPSKKLKSVKNKTEE